MLANMGGLRIDDRTVHGTLFFSSRAADERQERQRLLDERRQGTSPTHATHTFSLFSLSRCRGLYDTRTEAER